MHQGISFNHSTVSSVILPSTSPSLSQSPGKTFDLQSCRLYPNDDDFCFPQSTSASSPSIWSTSYKSFSVGEAMRMQQAMKSSDHVMSLKYDSVYTNRQCRSDREFSFYGQGSSNTGESDKRSSVYFYGHGSESNYTSESDKRRFYGDGSESNYTSESDKRRFYGDGLEPNYTSESDKRRFYGDGLKPNYTSESDHRVASSVLMSPSNSTASTSSPSTTVSVGAASPLETWQQQYCSPTGFVFKSTSGVPFEVPETSRFFVLKSYNAADVDVSQQHGIWTSTALGNKRLDKAMAQVSADTPTPGKVFLLFSVNGSGRFCGICEMSTRVDFTRSSDKWSEKSRWKGIFEVKWLLIKDVPNKFFYQLKVPDNENKPVTNSRDTQEVPFQVGISVLRIMSSFRN